MGVCLWAHACARACPYLAIPAQRQVLGVVDDLVVLVLALTLAQLLLLLFLTLLSGPGLLPLDVFVSQLPLLLKASHRSAVIKPIPSGCGRDELIKAATHPEDLHVLIHLSLQEANFLVALSVSAKSDAWKSE